MLALFLCVSAPLAAPQGTLTLFTDPAGRVNVTDCSADGRILSGWTEMTVFDLASGWVWSQAGGFTEIPRAPGFDLPPRPKAISGDGNVVVGFRNTPTPFGEAFRWTAVAGFEPLAQPDPANPNLLASGEATNGDGSLVGGYAASLGLLQAPTLWDSQGVASTVAQFGASPLFAGIVDVSEGDVAVGFWREQQSWISFRSSPGGGVTILEPFLPGGFAQVVACSGDGRFAFGVEGDAPGARDRVVRWNEDGEAELLFDFPPEVIPHAGMSADHSGRSLVLDTFRFSAASEALHWSEADGLRTMSELLDDAGLSGPLGARLSPRGISGDGNVIVGNEESGAGFVLRLNGHDPVPIGTDACPPPVANSTGAFPSLQAVGTDVATANDVVLWTGELPPRTFAMLIAGRHQAVQPGFGSGLGTLCLGMPFGRYASPGQIRSTGAFGRMSFRVDTAAMPDGMVTAPAMAGESWTFQGWYRDVNGGAATSNLTSARTILFR